MKIRMGFVTNSSSSSFIIAYKDLTSSSETSKSDQKYLNTLMKILEERLQFTNEDWCDTDEGTIFKSESEIKNYWLERYVYSDMSLDEYFKQYPDQKELYDNIIKSLKNGYRVIIKEVGTFDDDFREFVKELIDDKNVILIEETNY